MSRVDEIKAAIVQCYCCTNTYGESCSAICSDCENELGQDLDALIAEARAEAIEDVMKNAEKIQLEQIENLNQSTRGNGKMWARYMSTYLGHVQVACKRMLLKEKKNGETD